MRVSPVDKLPWDLADSSDERGRLQDFLALADGATDLRLPFGRQHSVTSHGRFDLGTELLSRMTTRSVGPGAHFIVENVPGGEAAADATGAEVQRCGASTWLRVGRSHPAKSPSEGHVVELLLFVEGLTQMDRGLLGPLLRRPDMAYELGLAIGYGPFDRTGPLAAQWVEAGEDWTASVADESAGLQDERFAGALRHELLRLLERATDDVFEDGYCSPMAKRALLMVQHGGRPVVRAIGEVILSGDAPSRPSGELLHWLGDLEDGRSYEARRELLERVLLDTDDLAIQDGACAGLAFMKDPRSIPCLKRSLERGSGPVLRENLQEALSEMESFAKWLDS